MLLRRGAAHEELPVAPPRRCADHARLEQGRDAVTQSLVAGHVRDGLGEQRVLGRRPRLGLLARRVLEPSVGVADVVPVQLFRQVETGRFRVVGSVRGQARFTHA